MSDRNVTPLQLLQVVRSPRFGSFTLLGCFFGFSISDTAHSKFRSHHLWAFQQLFCPLQVLYPISFLHFFNWGWFCRNINIFVTLTNLRVLLGYWPIQECFKMLFPSVISIPFGFNSFTVLCFYSDIMMSSIASLHIFGAFVQSCQIVVFSSFFSSECKCLKILPSAFPTAPFDFFVFLSILSWQISPSSVERLYSTFFPQFLSSSQFWFKFFSLIHSSLRIF